MLANEAIPQATPHLLLLYACSSLSTTFLPNQYPCSFDSTNNFLYFQNISNLTSYLLRLLSIFSRWQFTSATVNFKAPLFALTPTFTPYTFPHSMDQPYPYRPVNSPVERTAIYFSTEVPAFNAVNVDLAHTIILWSPNYHMHDCIVAVQLRMAHMYGGSILLYPFVPWELGSYLVQLPGFLNRARVVQEFLPWCIDRDIMLSAWDPNLYLFRQPSFAYRLDIIVTGFPLPLWHEFYIIRFLTTLGEVLHVNANNLVGYDKSCIEASIRSLDPRAVSRYVTVHFARFWAECRIHVKEWDDYPHIPARIRPYPDFADPQNPYGDDQTEEDALSPIRAHAISCHDSMRAMFFATPPLTEASMHSASLWPNPNIHILCKAMIKVGTFHLFPHYTLLASTMCVAALCLLFGLRPPDYRRRHLLNRTCMQTPNQHARVMPSCTPPTQKQPYPLPNNPLWNHIPRQQHLKWVTIWDAYNRPHVNYTNQITVNLNKLFIHPQSMK
ncbi:hypothetical protein FCM35_KLT09840 [Carex littledalei]|uniref:Uncharacterized protein n=1 Tax=Carex littledalei TaxID=544730 RepID=A0A833RKX1_9POAL|nr:hypothetical protein FCM35_KLT09840 [Carex littledalei]